MALLEDLLLRFRRVWAPPGPVAGQTGVPIDLTATLDEELRDLSAALAAIEEDGRAIIRGAESEAAAVVQSAQAEATRVVEAARARVPDVRAQRAAARVRGRTAEIEALVAQALQRADEVRAGAQARMGPLVDSVVAEVFAVGSAGEASDARIVGRR